MTFSVNQWNGWKLYEYGNWVMARHPRYGTKWFWKPQPHATNARYHAVSEGEVQWLDANLPAERKSA